MGRRHLSGRYFFSFRGHNRLFGGFGDPELYDLLCGNIDGFASGRIPSDAGFPVYSNQFAYARQHERPGLADLFDRGGGQAIEKLFGNFAAHFTVVSQQFH